MAVAGAGLRARAETWLASPRALPWTIALGVILLLPSIGSGQAIDDYLFAAVLRGLPLPLAQRGPIDLFRFANGDPRTARALQDIGELSWTADRATRGAFLRPISALTHILDYAAWPHSVWLMHAQSIAWMAVALFGASLVYRRFLGATWVAGLALLLYAADDTHAPVVGWIANRNAIVALALALPVLWLHDRARRDGYRPGAWLAPLLLGVALLAGESALAIVGYLAAHALHVDRGTWRARLFALAPYGAVVVLWRTAYTALGYGVFGSSLYMDPGRDPALYAAALPKRIPFLLLGEFALPRADFAEAYGYVPVLELCMIGFAVAVLALLAVAMIPLWKRDPIARFFTTGLLLALFPIAATAPGDRLLLFVGLGAMGLVAQLIASATSRGERLAATFFVVVHVVMAPPLLALKSLLGGYDTPNQIADRAIPTSPDVTTRTVVLVNPPGDGLGMFLIPSRVARGIPSPARLYTLAGVTTDITVTRPDARSLLLRPSRGFFEYELERPMRTLARPIARGSVIDLSAMSVTVTDSMPDGRPAEALFRFEVPLEDPSLLWLQWDRGELVPWVPLAIGQTARFPAFDLQAVLRAAREKPPRDAVGRQ